MTPQELSKLTLQEKQIKIAEICGWTKCRLAIKGAGGGTRYPTAHGFPPGRKYEADCPAYCRCLNAMHKAIMEQPPAFRKAMRLQLYALTDEMSAHFADAATMADAFLLTYEES